MDVDDYQLSNCRTAQRKQVVTIASEMQNRKISLYKMTVDSRNIVDAMSRAGIRAEEKKIEERIKAIDLFAGAGGFKSQHEQMSWIHSMIDEIVDRLIDELIDREIGMDMGYIQKGTKTQRYIQRLCFLCRSVLEREHLEKRRQELRTLRKIKTERVSAIIKIAWLRRNLSVGRSSTSSVNDPMLLSIPTPPTLMAANCSQGSGGTVSAFR